MAANAPAGKGIKGSFGKIAKWAKKNPLLAGLIIGGVILLAIIANRNRGGGDTVSMPGEKTAEEEAAAPGAGAALPEMPIPELTPGSPIDFPSFPLFGGGDYGGGFITAASTPSMGYLQPTQTAFDTALQDAVAAYYSKLEHEVLAPNTRVDQNSLASINPAAYQTRVTSETLGTRPAAEPTRPDRSDTLSTRQPVESVNEREDRPLAMRPNQLALASRAGSDQIASRPGPQTAAARPLRSDNLSTASRPPQTVAHQQPRRDQVRRA